MLYRVGLQYRESYGSRWKFKGGEDIVIESTEELSKDTIEDFLCESEIVWVNKFSRNYVLSIHRTSEASVSLLEDEAYEPIKRYKFTKGEPL